MSILDDNEKLKTLAMHDQLTGLPNRHYSLALLESRIKESKQFDIPFGIAILDIDHFKKVNDNYGHTIGDLVLQVFSKTCSGSIRKSDIIARYGGEEFLCIFTGVDSDSLKISLEQLRMLVSASTIRKDNLSVAITVSTRR
jgi:diguanylate cyclase (GGDEF)-like protein